MARPWYLSGTVEPRLPTYWRAEYEAQTQAESVQKPPKVLPPTIAELSRLPTKLKGKAKDKALTEVRKLLEAAIKGDREESVWVAMEAVGKLLGLGRPKRVSCSIAGDRAGGYWDGVRALTIGDALYWDVSARKFIVGEIA